MSLFASKQHYDAVCFGGRLGARLLSVMLLLLVVIVVFVSRGNSDCIMRCGSTLNLMLSDRLSDIIVFDAHVINWDWFESSCWLLRFCN